MQLQEHMIGAIERAREEAFRYALAVPEERIEWQPLDTGQSVLSMVRELAKTPDWAYHVLTGVQPENAEIAAAEQKAEMDSWKTVAACDEACKQKMERLYALYRNMPDTQLAKTKWLPFNGGRDHTYAELLDYPRWNFTYHLGQIAYIQSLYGDGEMHRAARVAAGLCRRCWTDPYLSNLAIPRVNKDNRRRSST